ncbi:hypothetical protein RJ641_003568 [Dillenia turbinata]|uniref:Transmembrane protein n=1 Tax=Dillenia turbinata TaxID=194707 RepID=A0AAN8VD00_9MAGN
MAEVSESPATSTAKPPEEPLRQPQVSGIGDVNMLGMIYPGLVGSMNQEHRNGGAGIYAVPVIPFMGSYAGVPSNTLIPLTYNVPSRPAAADNGTAGEEHGQVGQQQQVPQRQVVVRRFQIAFQIDLLLMLKLAAVIFLFNQDGSRQRLVLLVFFASLVYLYQTGALTPLIRWLSQGMHRAAAPPQPRRPAVRADDIAPAAHVGNENPAMPEGRPAVENENGVLMENEGGGVGPVEGNGGNQWWGVVKEIQMIVFGFITSLLPGYRNLD